MNQETDYIVQFSVFVAANTMSAAAQAGLDELRDRSVGPWEASVRQSQSGQAQNITITRSTPKNKLYPDARMPSQRIEPTGISQSCYMVTFEVGVTASRAEHAPEFALSDLRDKNLGPWNADVREVKFSDVEVHRCGELEEENPHPRMNG